MMGDSCNQQRSVRIATQTTINSTISSRSAARKSDKTDTERKTKSLATDRRSRTLYCSSRDRVHETYPAIVNRAGAQTTLLDPGG